MCGVAIGLLAQLIGQSGDLSLGGIVQGTANFDNTPEAQAAAFQVMPQLADLYNEETGHKLGIVYLDHISAKLFSMSGVVKDIMSY